MLEMRKKPIQDSSAVFRKDAEDEAYKRYKNIRYRNLIVKSLLAFVLGLFFGFVLKMA